MYLLRSSLVKKHIRKCKQTHKKDGKLNKSFYKVFPAFLKTFPLRQTQRTIYKLKINKKSLTSYLKVFNVVIFGETDLQVFLMDLTVMEFDQGINGFFQTSHFNQQVL